MDYVIRRMDRIEANVECLMCGRSLGQLFGMTWRDPSGRRADRSAANLTGFRDATPGAQPRVTSRFERFRCGDCGGMGMVGEVSITVVKESLPVDACPIHLDRKVARGRPPAGCRCHAERAAA
jgi:ribosomal protein S27E